MRLKLSLSRPSGGTDDIVVTADAAASISDVASTIARLDAKAPTDAVDRILTLKATLPGQAEPLLLPPDAALGEAWIGSGATVSIADAGTYYVSPGVANAPTVATLSVISGPDAGHEYPLKAGSIVLGREPGCDIVLNDPLISKRHVRFEVSTVVEVVDLGSANGVVVDGGIVTRLRVEKGETLLIGDSEIRVTVLETSSGSGVAPKAGPIFFNRSPKVEKRYRGKEFASPTPPAEPNEPPFPLLAMIAPLLMGGAMFLFTKNPTSLLFVLMSPVMLIGNFTTNKRREKSRLNKAIGRFDTHLTALNEQLATERVKEAALRTEESPSTQDAYEQAIRRGSLLWTRRPEHWSFLNVRLGVGTMTSRNVVKGALSGEMLPEYRQRLDALLEENRVVPGVPILDNLYESGALGIAGLPEAAAGSVNSLLIQLAALHSPAELVVAALVSPRWSRELEWLKWMPHTSSPQSPIETSHLADSAASGAQLLSALEGLIQERLAGREAQRRGAMEQDNAAIERGADVGGESASGGTESPVPAVVVVISDDVAVDRARLVQLAEQAADAGVYPIWIAHDVPALPAVCRTYLALDGLSELATVGLVRLGETITDVQTETVDAASALDFARRMAPVIDAGALVADSSDLPRSISLVTLLGHDMVETSDAVIDRWRQNASIHDRSGGPLVPKRAGKLRAVIGSAGVDPMHLDLRTQGPHALVGGTTGAGKSEFLQAWVLGMAAEYSPDRVTFLFVDYKGGSAFAECVNLPHTVGLVTDLSPHLVRRALTSLRAELHYREHLLNRKKAKDLLELEKRGDPDSPPALVLVIDEFAALVGEVPEFVDGVVDIAQRGRSLGIHLIMATQRPAGVIKDNLRANTNLRIALRMADESDSQDVVGIKDAAHFDPSIPGRGVAKTGPGRLALFQSGYAGGWTSREPEIPDIEIAELRFGGENRWEDVAASDVDEQRDLGPTDQKRLVASIVQASKSARIPAPRRPWLDELTAVYDLGRLPQRTDSELIIGVSDVAEAQQQLPVYFQPDIDGNISIFGTGGSGKSAVLRTLAAAAAITPRGGPVQVYGLDFGSGGLRMLEALPNVGAIIAGDDSERIIRLFRLLKDEFERRGPLYAGAEASSIVEYRRIVGKPEEPRILLLIDGFANFRDDFELAGGRQQWYEVFRDILTAGRPLGMHVAFTADRAGAVPTSVSASVQRKVVLRMAEDGYQMLDVPADILSAKSPAGRAIVDGYETQVAILGGSGSVPEQAAATRALAAAMIRAGAVEVPGIGSLPTEFAPTELPASIGDEPVLGIGDTDLGPAGFEPSGTMLVAGPPASGRTNALRWMAETMVRFDPSAQLYYFGNARSALAGERAWVGSATTPDDAVSLAKDLTTAVADAATQDRIVVVIESISDFLQSPADGPLVDLIKAIKRSDHLLLAEAETSAWNSSWPLFSEIKNARRGLLLQPEQIEGDILLKTQLPRLVRSEFPPGRGIFIAKGKFSRVQLPLV